MRVQLNKRHSYLRIGYSTLGASVGWGLFAARDIEVGSRPSGILCYFFGALWVCAEPEIDENPTWFGDYRKNLIQFEERYNPIIHPNGQSEEEKNMNEHLYLVASNCCIGSYCNTAAPEECNAMIDFIPPLEWNFTDGYTDLEHFTGIIRKKIVCLKLTRCVCKNILFSLLPFQIWIPN